MNTIYQVALLCLIFFIVALISYLILNFLINTKTEARISLLSTQDFEKSSVKLFDPTSSDFFKRIFGDFSATSTHKPMLMSSDTRIKLSNAGFNKTNSTPIFYALKSVSFFILPILTLVASILFTKNIQWEILYLTLLVTAGIGYYLPNALLEFLIRRRQRELFLVFPDALDLLRVCVEAGLGLDAAIERVGREIRIESVALSNEFSLLDLELRAGSSRSTSLKNLATRIGIEDIDSLVSMLIQADRFGTSIVESLKVHSQTLRTKRRLLAEEKAAKLPVKILLPLIFCIFPSLMTVLLGPAVINIARVLGPRISGH